MRVKILDRRQARRRPREASLKSEGDACRSHSSRGVYEAEPKRRTPAVPEGAAGVQMLLVFCALIRLVPGRAARRRGRQAAWACRSPASGSEMTWASRIV